MAAVGRVVVVGTGPGGLATADALGAEVHQGEVVLLGAEPHPPYDRPPLSKQVLSGAWTPERAQLRSPDDLAAAGIDWRPSTRAIGLEVDAHEVVLDDGSTLGYDALVIATGVRARHLPFGHDLAGVHVLRDLDDVLALRADLASAGPVAVVGAGFLGAETAAVCASLGHRLALIDAACLPMHEVLGDDVGTMVADLHREHGVHLHLRSSVDSFEDHDGRVSAVVLGDGTRIAAEAVVVAIGADPAVDWLAGSTIGMARPGSGIRCTSTGRAADGVWAVGDVAAWWDPLEGRHVRVEHRLTANEHARIVARDVLGVADPSPAQAPVPYFWSDQYDLKMQSFGTPSRRHHCQVVEGSLAERRFVAVYTDDADRVVGVVGAGRAKAVRSWRHAVQHRDVLHDGLLAPPA